METWILAVSGGVDSVVMLHKMMQQSERQYVIAHVDHGIRRESGEDEQFVKSLATQYGCTYETTRLELGLGASEEEARDRRWTYLRETQRRYNATAIVTGHHADDVVETIIINIMRGTGWRGLVSLREHATLRRPLLTMRKREVIDYARQHSLEWREDVTNADTSYLRNHVRHDIVPRCDDATFEGFMDLYQETLILVGKIDEELESFKDQKLGRYELIMWPDTVAREVLRHRLGSRTRREMDQVLLFARTARPNRTKQVSGGLELKTTVSQLIVSYGRN